MVSHCEGKAHEQVTLRIDDNQRDHEGPEGVYFDQLNLFVLFRITIKLQSQQFNWAQKERCSNCKKFTHIGLVK